MSKDSPIWYDEPNPHGGACFFVYWDNDCICVDKEEAKDLIKRLEDFIKL